MYRTFLRRGILFLILGVLMVLAVIETVAISEVSFVQLLIYGFANAYALEWIGLGRKYLRSAKTWKRSMVMEPEILAE